MTPLMRKPPSKSFCKVGIANVAVPIKTKFISNFEFRISKSPSFPLALTDESFDAALEHVALNEAEVIQKINAVQVIHFMTEGARQQVGSFDDDFLSVHVQTLEHDFFRTHDCG